MSPSQGLCHWTPPLLHFVSFVLCFQCSAFWCFLWKTAAFSSLVENSAGSSSTLALQLYKLWASPLCTVLPECFFYSWSPSFLLFSTELNGSWLVDNFKHSKMKVKPKRNLVIRFDKRLNEKSVITLTDFSQTFVLLNLYLVQPFTFVDAYRPSIFHLGCEDKMSGNYIQHVLYHKNKSLSV